MSFKTALVIVVYNQYCGDANTCNTILKNSVMPDLVLVVDNSTKEMNNKAYCDEHGFEYHSMQGNAGLSKAYNAAIELLKGKTDMVIWADDDTDFPEDYFEKLLKYADENPDNEVFLPFVKCNSIISPSIISPRKIVPITSLDELEGNDISGINSGMAVRFSIYKNYRYDESIFLDYLDHDFMYWCKTKGKIPCVMKDVEIHQNFFEEGSSSVAARKHRDKIFFKDYRKFEAKWGKSRLLTEWDVLLIKYYKWRVRSKNNK